MDIKQGFAKALRKARKTKGLSQESFSDVSSRTYVSTLERGLYTPTLDKIDALANVIGLHPLTLIAMAYIETSPKVTLEGIVEILRSELKEY